MLGVRLEHELINLFHEVSTSHRLKLLPMFLILRHKADSKHGSRTKSSYELTSFFRLLWSSHTNDEETESFKDPKSFLWECLQHCQTLKQNGFGI